MPNTAILQATPVSPYLLTLRDVLRAADVRHIVVTHLDFDHAGGLADFPNAVVHVMQREYDDATGPRAGRVARWFGFDAARDLGGLPPEILLVPLPGHARGHAGVAVRRGDGRMQNQARLRQLSIARRDEVSIACAHDAVELERCQAGQPL